MTKGGCANFIQDNKDEILRRLPTLDAEVRFKDTRASNLDKGSVDLIVTSPPYPMVEMWDEFGDYDDQHDMIEEVLEMCWDMLREGGIVCLNIGDATRSVDGDFQCYPNHSEVTVRARTVGFTPLVPVHWFKPTNKPNSFLGSGFHPPNCYVTQDTEYILILRKGSKRALPDDRVLWDASQFTKEERDTWFCQQWRVSGVGQDGTAQFPLTIPYRCIRMFSLLGDTVVDPFAGTGTTIQMARALGRHGIGFEVNEGRRQYVEGRLDKVHGISNRDILRNLIRNEKSGMEPKQFIENPNSLVDYFG